MSIIKKENTSILILFVLFVAIYLFRLQAIEEVDYQDESQVIITGILTQEPILKDNVQTFKMGHINVQTLKYPIYQYGVKLKIAGTLATQVTGRDKNQIWLINPSILKIPFDEKNLSFNIKVIKNITIFRKKLENIIIKSLPEPHASLLTGIILGIQKSLPSDFYQALKTTGTMHIIVASGMNISLTAGLLKEFLAKVLGRKSALIIGFFGIIFYCLLAGLTPPIVRAGMMAFILYLAQFLGREADGIWILFLTAGIMLIANPQILSDIGFQLSFTATAGLIMLSPLFKKVYKKTGFFQDSLAETSSALVFTAPVLIITFGHFNPLSLVPNALILWLIPLLMISGLILSLMGLIWLPLAQAFGLLLWPALTYFIRVIEFFGRFSFLDFRFEGLTWVFGAGYYLVLLSLMMIKKVNR